MVLWELSGRRSVGGLPEIEGGPDQGQMAEGLGEVADHAVVPRVVLLRQQADVVGQADQALEQRSGVVAALMLSMATELLLISRSACSRIGTGCAVSCL